MKSFSRILPVLILLAGVGAVYYWWHTSSQPVNSPTPVSLAPTASSSPAAEASPSIQYPVSSDTEESSGVQAGHSGTPGVLPDLESSDSSFEQSLDELFGKDKVDGFFNLKSIIRRIVVTVDNLTTQKQPTQEYAPLKEMSTPFRVTGKADELAMSPSNSERYAPLVALVEAVDEQKLVGVYAHDYPLFQSAYQELGKPGYFNDRLIQVIDHLLATPEVRSPIHLTRPTKHSRFKFADDQLESLSAGQKLLIRMGSENARVVKAKLRRMRSLLIHLGPKRKRSHAHS